MTVRATARVSVTVEISLSQPWDGSSSVDESHKTARMQAIEYIRSRDVHGQLRIVGTPKVTVITLDEDPP